MWWWAYVVMCGGGGRTCGDMWWWCGCRGVCGGGVEGSVTVRVCVSVYGGGCVFGVSVLVVVVGVCVVICCGVV